MNSRSPNQKTLNVHQAPSLPFFLLQIVQSIAVSDSYTGYFSLCPEPHTISLVFNNMTRSIFLCAISILFTTVQFIVYVYYSHFVRTHWPNIFHLNCSYIYDFNVKFLPNALHLSLILLLILVLTFLLYKLTAL